jgi:hypothetical protein
MLRQLEMQEQKRQQDAKAAEDSWTRYERQMERAGFSLPFQDELGGVGYKRRLSNKYLVWDCASTHGAVKIGSARKKSFWHRYAEKVGMKGVIFLPPRTPTLNPIELVFGFLKHQIRKTCPDEGYSSAGLIQVIHNAFRMVTPTMIRNWVKKAGYRFSPAVEKDDDAARQGTDLEAADNGVAPMDIDPPEGQEEKYREDEQHQELKVAEPAIKLEGLAVEESDNPADCYTRPGAPHSRKRSIICMDEHGTVIRKKRRGSIYFDRLLDRKLESNSHRIKDIKMENVAPIVN